MYAGNSRARDIHALPLSAQTLVAQFVPASSSSSRLILLADDSKLSADSTEFAFLVRLFLQILPPTIVCLRVFAIGVFFVLFLSFSISIQRCGEKGEEWRPLSTPAANSSDVAAVRAQADVLLTKFVHLCFVFVFIYTATVH